VENLTHLEGGGEQGVRGHERVRSGPGRASTTAEGFAGSHGVGLGVGGPEGEEQAQGTRIHGGFILREGGGGGLMETSRIYLFT
jgi:hypothetical protein